MRTLAYPPKGPFAGPPVCTRTVLAHLYPDRGSMLPKSPGLYPEKSYMLRKSSKIAKIINNFEKISQKIRNLFGTFCKLFCFVEGVILFKRS